MELTNEKEAAKLSQRSISTKGTIQQHLTEAGPQQSRSDTRCLPVGCAKWSTIPLDLRHSVRSLIILCLLTKRQEARRFQYGMKASRRHSLSLLQLPEESGQ